MSASAQTSSSTVKPLTVSFWQRRKLKTRIKGRLGLQINHSWLGVDENLSRGWTNNLCPHLGNTSEQVIFTVNPFLTACEVHSLASGVYFLPSLLTLLMLSGGWGTSGGCCLYQSARCHHLLLSGCEKFRGGVTHLVLHTICPIAPISDQSASAVMCTHSCSNLSLGQNKGVGMLPTCCFPVLNTRLNPSPTIHTHFGQQIDEHAGEEDLMPQRWER